MSLWTILNVIENHQVRFRTAREVAVCDGARYISYSREVYWWHPDNSLWIEWVPA
jgi:hypothetical protein